MPKEEQINVKDNKYKRYNILEEAEKTTQKTFSTWAREMPRESKPVPFFC